MRALAVHAHFYQPPREDPLTGRISPEPSASPFANWNLRITEECYRPNAELGSFEHLSFDLGPTLASWMAREAPEVLERIAESDRTSRERQGEGPALAQAFHHSILPLATRREKELEIAWGIADFQHRFGRRPRGLWLPETAADTETLEVLAEQGIELTILAPWQVGSPEAGGDDNRSTPARDPFRPAWIALPRGRRIAAFPYHGALSARLSFDPEASVNADRFADLLDAELRAHAAQPRDPEAAPPLLLLATDGELYGHHLKFRDYFLAQLLSQSAPSRELTLMPLARYLDLYPPDAETRLREATSWSCHHGVQRWAGVCPCTPKATWKRPLRRALRQLAEAVDTAWEGEAGPLLADPWALLRRSIEDLLGVRPLAELLREEARGPLEEPQIEHLRLLVKAQWQRHRMFASCAWFWGDLDRLEPRHALASAALAAEAVRRATGQDLPPTVLTSLAEAVSPRTGISAREIFEDHRARYRGMELR